MKAKLDFTSSENNLPALRYFGCSSSSAGSSPKRRRNGRTKKFGLAAFIPLSVPSWAYIPRLRNRRNGSRFSAEGIIDSYAYSPDSFAHTFKESDGAFPLKQLDSSSLRVLNWNTHKGKKDSWKTDFNFLARNMDLLLLQEACLSQTFLDSLNVSDMGWIFSPGFVYKRSRIPTGVLTACSLPPHCYYALRSVEPIIRTPKTLLLSRYKLSNSRDPLLVANVHAINFSLGVQSFRSQMNAVQEEIHNHRGPVILAGDFNTWNQDRMEVLVRMSRELSLFSVDFSADMRKAPFGNPLDHIFYKGLELMNSEVIKVDSSDHNPIIAEFRLATKS